jgi:hypothetical protein
MMKRMMGAVLGIALWTAWPLAARAAELEELSKYLAFIEGYQHLFEFCQAETQLPAEIVQYSRTHIAERRALIFAGLNEGERRKLMDASVAKKAQVIGGFMQFMRKEQPNRTLPELCKQDGFFAGVVQSETKSEDKESAAIKQAKN